MRLDTISKIESFMTDGLLSSPQIPLGVNIVRLAGTSDEEGITALARSITVRYAGSSLSLEQTQPMSIYRRMSFEVTLAAQSYLTQTGHDYVTQMCAGSYNTLTNQVPANTGSQIIEAFHMTREDFQGISDSSHYVYTQVWELTVQEINPLIALDPCVATRKLFVLVPVKHHQCCSSWRRPLQKHPLLPYYSSFKRRRLRPRLMRSCGGPCKLSESSLQIQPKRGLSYRLGKVHLSLVRHF